MSLNSPSAERCYYCGEPATGVDHTVPQVLLRRLQDLGDEYVNNVLAHWNRRFTVPCCIGCNSLLGAEYHNSLRERKAALKRKPQRRFKKLLAIPSWTDSELGRLDPMLRNYVLSQLVQQEVVRRRLAY